MRLVWIEAASVIVRNSLDTSVVVVSGNTDVSVM
jgi:hypothetical protein